MSEQRTPDELSPAQQTELICRKLLGLEWKYLQYAGLCVWANETGRTFSCIDRFETWAEAGLILEALSSHCPTLEYSDGKWDCYGGDPFESFFHAYADTAPLAIRAAALEHIRRQP